MGSVCALKESLAILFDLERPKSYTKEELQPAYKECIVPAIRQHRPHPAGLMAPAALGALPRLHQTDGAAAPRHPQPAQGRHGVPRGALHKRPQAPLAGRSVRPRCVWVAH